jgi:hypothetical protein
MNSEEKRMNHREMFLPHHSCLQFPSPIDMTGPLIGLVILGVKRNDERGGRRRDEWS